ncbi:MAG: NADH-ubiquinone oxidoreductase-F iron-sulfur binding region domain-containing protein, partial [Caldilinea sp.]
GTGWLEEILIRMEEGGGRVKDIDLLARITTFIAGKSFCPFGEASVWGLQSNLSKYRAEFEQYIALTNPEHEPPVIPIRPIYRPDTGQPSVATDSAFEIEGESPLNRDTRIKAIGD